MARLIDVARIAALKARQVGRLAAYVVGGDRPAEIIAYRGYGTTSRAYLHGRVVARPLYSRAAVADPLWRNLFNTYHRARSDPIAHAEVRLEFAGAKRLVTADDEGFFSAWLDAKGDHPGTGWQKAAFELVAPVRGSASVSATAHVLIPEVGARFGVISDLDDTVIQSRVTSFLQAARTVMLGNALTRLPFAGVAKFYTALAHGHTKSVLNPLFYVSSSPWNLYDVIDDFLGVQGIPSGPLLLRNWDFSPGALGGARHHTHKGAAIHAILETYPSLPFILIGDSGQKDPEIYRDIVHDNRGRILAVYIRDVVRTGEREAAITALAREVEQAGSTLLLVHDTLSAAKHAASVGWIEQRDVEAVEKEAAADVGATPGKKPAPI